MTSWVMTYEEEKIYYNYLKNNSTSKQNQHSD